MSRDNPQSQYVFGIAGIFFGFILGYVLATQQNLQRQLAGAAAAAAPAATPVTTAAAAPLADERELQTLKDVLARDPKNAKAATRLGDLLYDGQRYGEAVPYYQQAFALEPTNINVSTDLGTALWYTGRADEALAQYAKSLALNPTHAQTLFNVGIVKLDGKQDPKGALESWQKLLASNPGYPDAAKLQEFMARARQTASVASTR